MLNTWVLIVWLGVATPQATTVVVTDLRSEKICQKLGEKIIAESGFPLDGSQKNRIQCTHVEAQWGAY